MAQSLQVEGDLVDKQQVLWGWPGSSAGCSGYPDGDDEWEEWIRGLLELGGGEGQDGDVG